MRGNSGIVERAATGPGGRATFGNLQGALASLYNQGYFSVNALALHPACYGAFSEMVEGAARSGFVIDQNGSRVVDSLLYRRVSSVMDLKTGRPIQVIMDPKMPEGEIWFYESMGGRCGLLRGLCGASEARWLALSNALLEMVSVIGPGST